LGDACQLCARYQDDDGDNVCDSVDNCPQTSNPDQRDSDHDGIGDACDFCVGPGAYDSDGDGLCDAADNCQYTANRDQADSDGDGVGDACDNCPALSNPDQADSDFNNLGDACQVCPAFHDHDGDNVCDEVDNCRSTRNPNQLDRDGDGIGDACDNCPATPNPSQQDSDFNGVGDACQVCPAFNDSDGDNVCTGTDNCPRVRNPDQADSDGDGVGDACDNCPTVTNSNQADLNFDGIGDACQFDIANLIPSGTGSADCTHEWRTDPAPHSSSSGVPKDRLECTDGDFRCDFGAANDAACTFHVSLCFNVAESRFACSPTDIERVILTTPSWKPRNPTDTTNRRALENALTGLGGHVQGMCVNAGSRRFAYCAANDECDTASFVSDGVCRRLVAFEPPLYTQDACTDYAVITVPLRYTPQGFRTGTKNLRLAAVSSKNPGARQARDVDRLRLVCNPPR